MASDLEAVLNNLSDAELLIWHEQSGPDGLIGLPRLKRERLVYLVHRAGIEEAAPPRRMSPWEWRRVKEEIQTVDEIRLGEMRKAV